MFSLELILMKYVVSIKELLELLKKLKGILNKFKYFNRLVCFIWKLVFVWWNCSCYGDCKNFIFYKEER